MMRAAHKQALPSQKVARWAVILPLITNALGCPLGYSKPQAMQQSAAPVEIIDVSEPLSKEQVSRRKQNMVDILEYQINDLYENMIMLGRWKTFLESSPVGKEIGEKRIDGTAPSVLVQNNLTKLQDVCVRMKGERARLSQPTDDPLDEESLNAFKQLSEYGIAVMHESEDLIQKLTRFIRH